MAQATQIASFGPVYVDSAFHKPSSSYIVPKTVVSNCKTRMIYKKTHQWPKRRKTRRLGPFSSTPPSQSLLVDV